MKSLIKKAVKILIVSMCEKTAPEIKHSEVNYKIAKILLAIDGV